MIKYQTRPGVVLTEIAGEYALIAAKKLLDECPYITQISESSAFLWQQMTDGASLEELENAVCEEYQVEEPEDVRPAIIDFLQQLTDLNYLLQEDIHA